MSKIVHLSYTPENLGDTWRFHRLKKVAETLTKNCHGLLLDIGCNDCSITKFLPKTRFKYVGVDLSRQTLQKGKPHQRLLSDACNLPFQDFCLSQAFPYDAEHVKSINFVRTIQNQSGFSS